MRRLFLCAGLLILFSMPLPSGGAKEPEAQSKSQFPRIDLFDGPLYVKHAKSGKWQEIRGGETPLSLPYMDFPEASKPYLFPSRSAALEEWTLEIPFDLDSDTYYRLIWDGIRLPGLFLPGIGDGWEIMLNGYLIVSELKHPETGAVRKSRAQRNVAVPVVPGFFEEGSNILSMRFIGESGDPLCGLFYRTGYYIGDFREAQLKSHDFGQTAIFAITVFVFIYHLVLFLLQREARQFLYCSILFFILSVYFFSCSTLSYIYIENTRFLFRIDYLTSILALPAILLFYEIFVFRSVSKFVNVCIILFSALASTELFLSNAGSEMALRIFQYVALPLIPAATAYEGVRTAKAIPIKRCLTSSEWRLFFGIIFLVITVMIDIMFSAFLKNEIIVLKIGVFVFILDVTLSLAQRGSARLHRFVQEGIKQQSLISLFLQNTAEIILLLDNTNKIANCSAALRSISAQQNGEFIGRDYIEVLMDYSVGKEEFRKNADLLKHAIQFKISAQFQQKFYFSKNGEARDYEAHFTPLFGKNNAYNGSLLILTDMTDIVNAREAAVEANHAKSAFLATMSHEIRTPLNIILGLAEIELQNEYSCAARPALKKIRTSGTQLLHIISSILDVSKIESGKFELVHAHYDLPSLINDSAELNIVRRGSKPIQFELSVAPQLPVTLIGDELRVKQIFNNMLSNAFKYTEKGKVTLAIAVGINHSNKDDDRIILEIKVSDTGIGIREEDLEKLFSEYRQLDLRASRTIEGTGLGLSITKKLCMFMGGDITVQSEFGRGTTFTAHIFQQTTGKDYETIGDENAKKLEERAWTETQIEKGQMLRRAAIPYARVLVVDDVLVNHEVTRGLLKPYLLEVDCVSSGREAVAAIKKGKPLYNAVFMDHMMPEMDGIEAAKQIRKWESTQDTARRIPIIALTANATVSVREEFQAAGCDDFLTKPIDILQLDKILNTFVRDKSKEKEGAQTMPDTNNTFVSKIPPLEGVNIAENVMRFGSDEAYLSILSSFVRQTPQTLNDMRTPSEANLDLYAIKVHGLKGASYGIGANVVGDAAFELEKAAKAGDIAFVLEKNDAFIRQTETLLQNISRLLETAACSAPGQKPRLIKPSRALLEQVRSAASRYKSSELEALVKELSAAEYEVDGGLVTWLQEAADNLDYDAIVERLKTEGI